MFSSPEKSFLLLVYAEVMARASLPRRPSCVPRGRHLGDPRVFYFLDISATVDASFPADCSDFGSTSLFGEIFELSSKSRHCNDDSRVIR
jgi:hypothetical protein